MKHYISILTLFIASLIFFSCTEDQIEVFGDQNYLCFKQESDRVYRFTFAAYPDTDEFEFELPLTLIGKLLSVDKQYKVDVVKTGEISTTASTASYRLPDAPVFRQDLVEDTLKITLINNSELSQEKTLVLRIAENDNFLPGPVKYQNAVIYLSNYLVQPDWWDAEMATVFLGHYSDIEYREFIHVTGISDMTDMSIEKITAYVSTLIYHLRNLDEVGTPVYESDGKTKVIDTIPYNNSI